MNEWMKERKKEASKQINVSTKTKQSKASKEKL